MQFDKLHNSRKYLEKVITPKFFQIIFDKLLSFDKIVIVEGVTFIQDLRALAYSV